MDQLDEALARTRHADLASEVAEVAVRRSRRVRRRRTDEL